MSHLSHSLSVPHSPFLTLRFSLRSQSPFLNRRLSLRLSFCVSPSLSVYLSPSLSLLPSLSPSLPLVVSVILIITMRVILTYVDYATSIIKMECFICNAECSLGYCVCLCRLFNGKKGHPIWGISTHPSISIETFDLYRFFQMTKSCDDFISVCCLVYVCIFPNRSIDLPCYKKAQETCRPWKPIERLYY